jgi:hypothetical protein
MTDLDYIILKIKLTVFGRPPLITDYISWAMPALHHHLGPQCMYHYFPDDTEIESKSWDLFSRILSLYFLELIWKTHILEARIFIFIRYWPMVNNFQMPKMNKFVKVFCHYWGAHIYIHIHSEGIPKTTYSYSEELKICKSVNILRITFLTIIVFSHITIVLRCWKCTICQYLEIIIFFLLSQYFLIYTYITHMKQQTV